ncbi:TetR/AcrR family transcriptional regulator [Kribbella sandramycini]|uniref:AcrR family transcriptional regulator n=1 Tax=Kribbella sandramycini TaxID=60450 RepID=A0A7Y4L5R1_9ACTN|nr:TetR/AcrR family transcriptional regulator [Kribbella sandramycini]MBB6570652.1 AcrR family transcriptional regulator [Kribbella sandramycini]NOL43796.1 TetR/AcrR family transcriptional regulator [Kribbella sandramycini]
MGLRELKRERTRRLIADKAFELFTDHGFGRTTVEQIAAAAEVGPSTLYRYFPTKETLVLEFVEDCLMGAVAWFREQPEGELPDALQAVIERVLAELERNPDRVRAVFELAEQTPSVSAHLSELIWSFRNKLADELVRRLTGLDPQCAEFTAALSAGTVMNIIETVVRMWVDDPAGTEPLELACQAMSLLRGGGIPMPSVGSGDNAPYGP